MKRGKYAYAGGWEGSQPASQQGKQGEKNVQSQLAQFWCDLYFTGMSKVI